MRGEREIFITILNYVEVKICNEIILAKVSLFGNKFLLSLFVLFTGFIACLRFSFRLLVTDSQAHELG